MLIYREAKHRHDSYGKGLESTAIKALMKVLLKRFKTYMYHPSITTRIPKSITPRLSILAQLLDKKRNHSLDKFYYDRYLISLIHLNTNTVGYAQQVYNNNLRVIGFKLGSYRQWTYKRRVKKPNTL